MDEGLGEDEEGMAIFVKQLPKLLNTMLGRNVSKPKILYSHRGSGMYVPRTGQATESYDMWRPLKPGVFASMVV